MYYRMTVAEDSGSQVGSMEKLTTWEFGKKTNYQVPTQIY